MDAKQLVLSVVAALIQIRRDQGMSQRALARITGFSPSGIRDMESGKVAPTLFYVAKICEALDTTLYDILDECQVSEREAK